MVIFLFSYDFVNIYDGADDTAGSLDSLTGILPSPVQSTGNVIFINFLSDFSTTNPGFKIEYEAGKSNYDWKDLFESTRSCFISSELYTFNQSK